MCWCVCVCVVQHWYWGANLCCWIRCARRKVQRRRETACRTAASQRQRWCACYLPAVELQTVTVVFSSLCSLCSIPKRPSSSSTRRECVSCTRATKKLRCTTEITGSLNAFIRTILPPNRERKLNASVVDGHLYRSDDTVCPAVSSKQEHYRRNLLSGMD